MLKPTHPGELLRFDVLPALNMSVGEAAKFLGVSRNALSRVINQRAAISPEMALRLGKFCGNGPNLWINMQNSYDLWKAEKKIRTQLMQIKTRKAQ